MTIPKKAGYSARATFLEREKRMKESLVCTDDVADVGVLRQEPLHSQLVAALLKHGCAEAAGALLHQPNDPAPASAYTTPAAALPQTSTNGDMTCGYCEDCAQDTQQPQQAGADSTVSGSADAAMDVDDSDDEEQEDDSDSEQPERGHDRENGSARDFAAAAQELYPAEWARLCSLHAQAHSTLAHFSPGEEREHADRLMSDQLRKARAELLQKVDARRRAMASGSQSDASSSRHARSEDGKQRRNLPAAALATLKKWLYDHRDNPYPTEAEKRALARAANLDIVQVRNWYANVRNRKRNILKLKGARNRNKSGARKGGRRRAGKTS